MRITRLQLRHVRRYQELDVGFAPGFTVVRGPNEAGKTTLQRALELALTRKATSASADLEELRSWDAPADARPEIALEFVQEDVEGTRTGRLEKAFRGQKGTARLEIDGEVTTDPAAAAAALAALTGAPTEAFFRSTASVHHQRTSGRTSARISAATGSTCRRRICGTSASARRTSWVAARPARSGTSCASRSPARARRWTAGARSSSWSAPTSGSTSRPTGWAGR